METTIKVSKETKERILSLDISEKGKTFEMIINELISYYQKIKKNYDKDYKTWKSRDKDYNKHFDNYKEDVKKYRDEKDTWDKLLKWAKTKGFKP